MRRLIFLLAGFWVFSAAAWAEDPTFVGTFSDWSAFTQPQDGAKICYVGGIPKKEEGDYQRRGDTYTLVTHRPKDNVKGELSVEAGYTYKPDSEVELDIDGTTFRLFTKDGNAWAYTRDADKALVAAMKKGRQMIIRGTSSRGTLTTDTYSLKGFTAAIRAIDKACGGSS